MLMFIEKWRFYAITSGIKVSIVKFLPDMTTEAKRKKCGVNRGNVASISIYYGMLGIENEV